VTQPINPNTNIPMSLQVERLHQMRNIHNAQQQGQLAQQSEVEEEIQRQRVNSNNETDQARIKEKEESPSEKKQNKKNKKDKRQETAGNEEGKKQQETTLRKGKYIDIKV